MYFCLNTVSAFFVPFSTRRTHVYLKKRPYPCSLACAIMSNHFAHGYALLIGVGRTVESRFSLPVTVKDVQALKAVLIDPNLCAYLDDAEHICLLQNEQTTRSAILAGLRWFIELV